MILQLLIAWIATRINGHQDHVIRYLREENRILKAKLQGKQIRLTDTERRRLAVLAHAIDRKELQALSTIATPDTLRRWYRRLVVHAPSRTPQDKRLGRPRVAVEIEQLVVRMATENPRWGSRRIQGALANLGYHIHNTIVHNILRRNNMDPAPIRGRAGMRWSQFVTLHFEVLAASGFFEARLSPLSRLWSAMTQPGCNLCAQAVTLACLIRHGVISGLALVGQSWRALGFGWLAYVDTRCCLVLDRPRRASDEALSTRGLVSSPPAALPRIASGIEQNRSPPEARQRTHILTDGPSNRGRGASTPCQTAVSTVLMIEPSREPSLGQSRYRGSSLDSYRAG